MKNMESRTNENLSPKYKKANLKFKNMIKNKPDFSKMEPIEIYKWFESIVKLTKI